MSYGAIARGVAKGIQKAIKTPGRKTIGGVKVKKIPTGKRSRSEKEMQRIAREDPIKASPQWPKRGVVTKGARRKSGETGLAAPVDVKPSSKSNTEKLRKKRKQVEAAFKVSESKRKTKLRSAIEESQNRIDYLNDRLDSLSANTTINVSRSQRPGIVSLRKKIKELKKNIQTYKKGLKTRSRPPNWRPTKLPLPKSKIPKSPKQKTGGIVKRKAGGQIGTGAALRGFGKGYKT